VTSIAWERERFSLWEKMVETKEWNSKSQRLIVLRWLAIHLKYLTRVINRRQPHLENCGCSDDCAREVTDETMEREKILGKVNDIDGKLTNRLRRIRG